MEQANKCVIFNGTS